MSAEPSMEDILSSIKRIIAEEGDPAPVRPRRQARQPVRTADAPEDRGDGDEVLELNDPMPIQSLAVPSALGAAALPPAAAPAPLPPTSSDPEPDAMPPAPRTPSTSASAATPEPIVSQQAAAATRGSLDSLSRMMMKPDPVSDGTLEGLVRDMLRPMLREWLDANLPGMVESMVTREIAKITGRPE